MLAQEPPGTIPLFEEALRYGEKEQTIPPSRSRGPSRGARRADLRTCRNTTIQQSPEFRRLTYGRNPRLHKK